MQSLKTTIAFSVLASLGLAGMSSAALAKNSAPAAAKMSIASLATSTSPHAYSASCGCPYCTAQSQASSAAALDALSNL
jgi:hypothetical protein